MKPSWWPVSAVEYGQQQRPVIPDPHRVVPGPGSGCLPGPRVSGGTDESS